MIEVRDLQKEFDGVRALQGLSFRVERGEIFGFIGPNGAGKTTTMRILATLLEPTNGDAFINGYSVLREPHRVKQFIGFMPDFFGIYDGLTVEEFLIFFAGAFRLPKARRLQAVDDVLALVDLGEKRHLHVEALSAGMRQRLCLAKTLLHDPQVLLLDEPAAGLDPRGRIELRELLKTLGSLGKTIFISSHILPELADFCHRVGIIESGKMIYTGRVDEALEPHAKTRRIRLRFLGDSSGPIAILSESPLVQEIRENKSRDSAPGSLEFRFGGQLEDLADLAAALVSQGVRLVGLEEEAVDLEDLFLSVTQRGIS